VTSDTQYPVRSIGAAARGVGAGPRPPWAPAAAATINITIDVASVLNK
jgi:hypothetical protein